MIAFLSLLIFLLAGQPCSAEFTDEEFITHRLSIVKSMLSQPCLDNYYYCAREYIGAQDIDYCEVAKTTQACALTQNEVKGNITGPCNEDEYTLAKTVACTCTEEINVWREIEQMAAVIFSDSGCLSHIVSCTHVENFADVLTLKDLCDIFKSSKECLTGPNSTMCTADLSYEPFEQKACQNVECNVNMTTEKTCQGDKCNSSASVQHSLILMIFASTLKLLQSVLL